MQLHHRRIHHFFKAQGFHNGISHVRRSAIISRIITHIRVIKHMVERVEARSFIRHGSHLFAGQGFGKGIRLRNNCRIHCSNYTTRYGIGDIRLVFHAASVISSLHRKALALTNEPTGIGFFKRALYGHGTIVKAVCHRSNIRKIFTIRDSIDISINASH